MSGRGLVSGKKFRMALALPVGAVMNCGDNTGAKNLYVIAVGGVGARLNRLPAACVGDYLLATVKKGKPELRKKGASRVDSCRRPGAGCLSAAQLACAPRAFHLFLSGANPLCPLQSTPPWSSASASLGAGGTASSSTLRTTQV